MTAIVISIGESVSISTAMKNCVCEIGLAKVFGLLVLVLGVMGVLDG